MVCNSSLTSSLCRCIRVKCPGVRCNFGDFDFFFFRRHGAFPIRTIGTLARCWARHWTRVRVSILDPKLGCRWRASIESNFFMRFFQASTSARVIIDGSLLNSCPENSTIFFFPGSSGRGKTGHGRLHLAHKHMHAAHGQLPCTSACVKETNRCTWAAGSKTTAALGHVLLLGRYECT